MNMHDAIARLRSMFDAYEHEHRGFGPDMAEVGIFLEWAEKHAGDEQPARTVDNVTECFIYASSGMVNTCRRGEPNTTQTLKRTTGDVELQIGQRMIVELVDAEVMRLEVLPPEQRQ